MFLQCSLFSDWLTLKMKELWSFETSVSTYKPKRRNIPENLTFYGILLYIKRLLANRRNYNVIHNVII